MAVTLTCLHCGGDLDDGDRYCPACGVEALRCKSCSQLLLPTDLTCPNCGVTAEHAVPAGPMITPADASSDLGDIIGRLRRATLGEFEIGRELGRGGMAAVFLAHEIALDRKVAIKVMSPGLMMGEGMVDRFSTKRSPSPSCNHPNIVSVYSVRQAEGLHFFVMRYVQGRSLEQVLQEAGRLPLPIVRSILYQVGSALAYAHRSRVVHRDIKPANILIDDDGNAVVTDFGIAKAAERPSRPMTGALVGTPAYMSPEQCAGGEVSGASDQYSLGVVAYEMITGGRRSPAPRSPSCRRTSSARRVRCASCVPTARPRWRRPSSACWKRTRPRAGPGWPTRSPRSARQPLADEHPLRTELSRIVAGTVATLTGSATPSSPAPRTRASGAISGPSRPVGGITIMPAPAGLEVGDSFTLVAVIRGQYGTRLPPRAVEWATDAPAVLRVDAPAGLATALAPGTAMVTATCKGIIARLRVDVAAPRADDIVIEPMVEPLQAGEEIRLDATARDKHGWPVYRPVNWLSADAHVAVVTPHGTIAGLAPGTVRITAALDDARASIVIPVLPPRVAGVDIADPPASIVVGRSAVLDATPLDRGNTPLPGRPIVWSTSDASIATVTEEGRVTGMRTGTAVLTATCEGVRAIIRIGVIAGPQAVAAPPKGRVTPSRRARRTRRRAILAAVASLAAVGVWLLLQPAPLDERSGAAPAAYVGGSVGIDSSPPVAVVITQRPARSLRPDSTASLAAEARDAAGNLVPTAAVVWTSSDSTIVRVDPSTGRVRAIRTGRVLVAATSGSGRDSVVISVRRPGARVLPVASVTIGALPTLRVGDSVPLRALVRGVNGDTLLGRRDHLGIEQPAVATIEALTGMTRAHTPGTALILARSGNESSFTELTVLPPAVTAIQILGARPMAVRETLALRVASNDALGGDLTGVTTAWSSSDTSIAQVDETTGAVVGRAPGSVRITASADGATASIRLTVLPRPEPIRSAAEDEAIDARLMAGVEECYGALQSKDLIRLRAMWHPDAGPDEERLRRLSRILRDSSANVGERIDHAPAIGLESASFEFGVPLAWRESSSARSGVPVFRAEFVRTGGRWELSTCRITSPSSF